MGQAETEIFTFADICLLVLTPGYGDIIQALKAGTTEIASHFVINKADLPGIELIEKEIKFIISDDKSKFKKIFGQFFLSILHN